ncbi:hypothetical protein HG530_001569 [Fusarium avenaceum]|nr:hypothetical protein HG530_001569 [Fusarium avenaceum]
MLQCLLSLKIWATEAEQLDTSLMNWCFGLVESPGSLDQGCFDVVVEFAGCENDNVEGRLFFSGRELIAVPLEQATKPGAHVALASRLDLVEDSADLLSFARQEHASCKAADMRVARLSDGLHSRQFSQDTSWSVVDKVQVDSIRIMFGADRRNTLYQCLDFGPVGLHGFRIVDEKHGVETSQLQECLLKLAIIHGCLGLGG